MAMGGEQQRYLELLSKGQGRDSDDDSGSSSDDGFLSDSDVETPRKSIPMRYANKKRG